MKRGDLIFVVLLLGCSPHFESGKTQCSDTGECPDGFTCVNNGAGNFCYDDSAPMFTGGTGGPGGTGGSGGRSGGTGGSGGGSGGTTGCANPAYPTYCGPIGTFPGGCWATGVVCSTITNCGTSAAPDYTACETAGYHPDCNGTKCLPPSADAGSCPTPAAGGTCNVFPACGCPTGQVCYPNTQATGLKCYPSGSLGEGADCTNGACASGFGCFGDVCKTYCQLDSDCPAVDSARTCVQTYWDSVNMIAGVSACARVCDPVSPQNPRNPLLACPVGFGCSSWGTSYPGATDCVPQQSGTGIAGAVCATDADCTPGYYCSNGGTCFKYCYTVADCPTGKLCKYPSTPIYAGTTQVGYCN